ncbi:predicted protein, partial [Nematostella vectensis]
VVVTAVASVVVVTAVASVVVVTAVASVVVVTAVASVVVVTAVASVVVVTAVASVVVVTAVASVVVVTAAASVVVVAAAASVVVVTAAASVVGCKYCHDSFKRDYGPWTAFRSLDYGFTRMKIHNNTHLYFEQVSIDKDYEVIDKVWLIKDTHGPASFQDAPQTSSQQPSDKKMRVNKIRNSGSEISQAVTDMIKNYYSKLKGVKDPYL